jgi:hypothetical protein
MWRVALAEPPKSMPQPRIAGIVDIVRGKHMQSRRQEANAEPVACVNDAHALLIGTNNIASGVAILANLVLSQLRGGSGITTSEQLAQEQTTALRILWRLRLGPVRDRYEQAVLIDPEPSTPSDGIDPGDRGNWTWQQLGRSSAASIRFLAVCGHD